MITTFLKMASTRALGTWQCLPGPIFRPHNLNIKIGPGDKASMYYSSKCLYILMDGAKKKS